MNFKFLIGLILSLFVLSPVAFSFNELATYDLNGTELTLDADGDTSITADTDDQIDIEIAGADDFSFTANTFTALSGSSIVTPTLVTSGTVDLNGVADALVVDADADTTISAPTDDQIDIEVAGADDFQITANTFTALSGSSILTNTISETTSTSGVTIDGVLLKDGEIAASALPELTVASSANAACNTTCGIADCWVGLDTDTVALVSCATSSADHCLCDGATS